MDTGRIDYLGGLRRSGPPVILAVGALALAALGLVVLYSVKRAEPAYVTKQAIWLGLGFTGAVVTSLINLEWCRKFIWPLGVVILALLVMVLIPGIGKDVNGARRWLPLGPMSLQVSDFARIGLVFVMAHYLASNQRYIGSFWRGFVIPCGFIGTVAGLIIVEPDFGTAFLFGVVGVTLLFLAGTRLVYLIPSGILAVVAFSVAVYHDPERLSRVTSFLNIEANKENDAYQLWQGILGFGAGGVEGVGLGNGRQQMAFLPEAHTDFIFPIIGEELGFVVTGSVVLVFMVLFTVCVFQLRRANNLYTFILATGALLFITAQALINLGVVTGLLPTKGMSLPFISYGGSNLLVMSLMVGILVNCFRRWNMPPPVRARDL